MMTQNPQKKEASQELKRAGVQVQSVARALEVLACFRHTPELGVSELSAQMQLNKSTIFGLVNTLTAFGYLEQVESSRKYRLGIALFEFGNLVLSRIDVRTETKERCLPLAQNYPATVHIATHDSGEVLYIDKLERGDFLITASSIGRRAPMYCTGVGKALLAHLPEEYREKYVYSRPMQALTPNTITDRAALEQALEEVRRTGIAMDREEIEPGLTCMAAPILQHGGLPALAVSLSFPYGRILELDQEQVKRDLLACTEELSARLGYKK